MLPVVVDHIVVQFLTWCRNEDYENIGLMELHVIPNVYSEYSEQKIQANGRPYRTIIHSTWSGSSIRFTFDLFSRMSTRKSLDAQHQGFFSWLSWRAESKNTLNSRAYVTDKSWDFVLSNQINRIINPKSSWQKNSFYFQFSQYCCLDARKTILLQKS